MMVDAYCRFAFETTAYQEEMEALERARAGRRKSGGGGMLACERESPSAAKKRKLEEEAAAVKREEARREGTQFPLADDLLVQRELAHRKVTAP